MPQSRQLSILLIQNRVFNTLKVGVMKRKQKSLEEKISFSTELWCYCSQFCSTTAILALMILRSGIFHPSGWLEHLSKKQRLKDWRTKKHRVAISILDTSWSSEGGSLRRADVGAGIELGEDMTQQSTLWSCHFLLGKWPLWSGIHFSFQILYEGFQPSKGNHRTIKFEETCRMI